MNAILEQSNGSQIKSFLEKKLIKRAVIVTGATENHGQHLPYGSDTLTPWAIATRLMKFLDGLVLLPPVSYGMSSAHTGFPLTISIRPDILAEIYFDIFDSIAKSKIPSILVINGHDGNIISLRQAGYRLKNVHPHIHLDIFELWGVHLENIFGPDMGAGHAGETETSVLLYLHPQLVNMSEAKGASLDEDNLIWTNKSLHERTASGATGNPSKATAEHGEKAISNAVEYLVQYLQKETKNVNNPEQSNIP
ncbi:MAG: creatininase family protein [Anaerolineaceae bacterium]|nr:creatininase family protein [Anaerolineaceae bacterium]